MLGEVYGAWDAPETCMSSTWRELEAVNRVLKSNAESLTENMFALHASTVN
jgi:hypothetical protein